MKIIGGKIAFSSLLAALIGLAPIISPTPVLSQDKTPRVFPLPELANPRQICVHDQRAFIVDGASIVVYDIKDGRFLMKIGKKGQGPGEFRSLSRLDIVGDKLVIQDYPTIKFFSLDGKYTGEIKGPGGTGFYPFLPVAENFVGFPMEFINDGSLSPPSGHIYDKDFKLIKKFYGEFSPGLLPPPPPGSAPPARKPDFLMIQGCEDFAVQGDRIFVADSRKGLSISIFDKNGIPRHLILHQIEKIKVSEDYVEQATKERKASKDWDLFSAYNHPVFPDGFPSFFGFKLDGNRIHVLTPDQRGGLYEVIDLDLKGYRIGRGYRFPLNPDFANLELFNRRYDIKANQIIWFAYNDNKEMFELHVQ